MKKLNDKQKVLKAEKREKKRLEKECDHKWFIKFLKPCCEVCGETGYLQGHHFYYKSSYPALRYEPNNHITLCRKCHFLLHHQDPKKIENRIIEKRGQLWHRFLKRLSQEKLKLSYKTAEYYKSILNQLNEN